MNLKTSHRLIVVSITLLMITLTLVSTDAMAVVHDPDPTKPVEHHWDTILGSGSFAAYSFLIRGICSASIFGWVAWVLVGLYQVVIDKKDMPVKEGMMYLFRVLLIMTISIYLITV